MRIKGLKQNIAIAKYTTYKIGGPADYFISIKNSEELKQALKFANDNSLPFFILAGGSNVLFSDEGYRGLIIKIDNKGLKINGDEIMAEAGVLMNDAVSQSIENNLAGLEWAGGLPGTIGGAIRGNAGCFGGEIRDVIKEVGAVTYNSELKLYSNKDCEFGYRDSVFKHNNEIIMSAVFKLRPGNKENLKAIVFDHIKYRQSRYRLPSCGSVFKNCPLEKVPQQVQEKFKEKIKTDPFPILPVAVLIGASGLVGKIKGGAIITKEHANIIHNFNNAKATEVLDLINLTKKKVKQKFDINLEEEVQLII
ncbi:MAG: UDP-N-acetylmuramate dehydrogenase [Candidatus Azambacteria bacterium]|nr:UDP-N-acetylmuramate dehydrogenase [Candidatus Azambacteria bacterium]